MKFKLDLAPDAGDQRLLASQIGQLATAATTTTTTNGVWQTGRQEHDEDKVVRVCLASVKA